MRDKIHQLLENINKEAEGTEFLVSSDTKRINIFKHGTLQEVVELEDGDDLLEVVKKLKEDYL